MEPYIYIDFLQKILFYYFIDLCQILNRFKLGLTKFVKFQNLLIFKNY